MLVAYNSQLQIEAWGSMNPEFSPPQYGWLEASVSREFRKFRNFETPPPGLSELVYAMGAMHILGPKWVHFRPCRTTFSMIVAQNRGFHSDFALSPPHFNTVKIVIFPSKFWLLVKK